MKRAFLIRVPFLGLYPAGALGGEFELGPVPGLATKYAVARLHLLLDGFLVDLLGRLVQLFTMGDGKLLL